MTLAAGTRLGPYEIVAPLGAGGMGEVYRARDSRLSREVAIKVLPVEVSADQGRLRRFEKEAKAASALNHPNLVTIYDVGSESGVSYIAMELVEGTTLRGLLVGGPLPIKRLLQIAPQITEGLSKAHESGIVHRDLKPENVMVTKEGLVKILDFGLAKLTPTVPDGGLASQLPTMTGTTPGVIVGTVGYMSPEQAGGEAVDFRSDQFSFGSILYEMVTGNRAFQKVKPVDTLAAILNEEPEPIDHQVPAPLRWIVERCLAKEPEGRYLATGDLARELSTVRDKLSEVVSGTPMIAAGPRLRGRLLPGIALVLVLTACLFAGRILWRAPTVALPSLQRISFGNGLVTAARFSPDGRTIVYSARWDGKPLQIFLTRSEAPGSQMLDLPVAGLLSISSHAELAIVTGKPRIGLGGWFTGGTLATVPLAGGAPRELVEGVRFADWAPDGKAMLVVRANQLEFPAGNVIRRSRLIFPRFSPSGDRIAFIENDRAHVTDLAGNDLVVSREAGTRWGMRSLAWSPSGDEVWFTVTDGDATVLRTMSLAGRERVLWRMPRTLTVFDASRDGRLLVGFHRRRDEVWAGFAGEARERNLTIFDFSYATGLSADGKTVLENEGDEYYLRTTDGSPPKKLGEGIGSALSPDGKSVVVVRRGPPTQLVLVPTGAGDERPLERGSIEEHPLRIWWSIDGRRLFFQAREKGHENRLYVQDIAGGAPRPLTPDGLNIGNSSISPDGRFVLVEEDGYWIYPVDGGEKRRVTGLRQGVDFVWRNWSDNGRYVYAWDPTQLPLQVFRVELASGEREPWITIIPQDPAGIWNVDAMITPDGKSYVYNCQRELGDLYLVEGLR